MEAQHLQLESFTPPRTTLRPCSVPPGAVSPGGITCSPGGIANRSRSVPGAHAADQSPRPTTTHFEYRDLSGGPFQNPTMRLF
jgi:hypothetical protein